VVGHDPVLFDVLAVVIGDCLGWNSPNSVDRQLSGSMLPFVLGRAQVA
jgi:hypothetical protein